MTALAKALIHPCNEFFKLTLAVEYNGRVFETAKAVVEPDGEDGADEERRRAVMLARMRAGDDWVISRMDLCIHTLECKTGCRDYLYHESKKSIGLARDAA